MSDAELARDVLDQLLLDQRVDSERINVTADQGKVVLSGVVNTFHESWDAAEDAWSARGVTDVQNDLRLDESAEHVLDETLADTAAAALDASSLVPRDAVQVTVTDGWVTMTGTVKHYYQRSAAEHVVRHLRGLYGYRNLVTVGQGTDLDLGDRITDALARNASLDRANITVTVAGGLVTLTGTVHSIAEKKEAERVTELAPGVAAIENQLVIRHQSTRKTT